MTDPSGYTPRVAIITGSARGLGFSIASKLADDGVDIVINDLASEIDKINGAVEEIKKKGRGAIGIPADVTNEEDVKALVEKAVEALGSVDIVSGIALSIGCKYLQPPLIRWSRMLVLVPRRRSSPVRVKSSVA